MHSLPWPLAEKLCPSLPNEMNLISGTSSFAQLPRAGAIGNGRVSRFVNAVSSDTRPAGKIHQHSVCGGVGRAPVKRLRPLLNRNSVGFLPDGSSGDMKFSEIVRLMDDDGWALVTTRDSDRHCKHASKPGRVTFPWKPSDDLAPGGLTSILKQAGLKK